MNRIVSAVLIGLVATAAAAAPRDQKRQVAQTVFLAHAAPYACSDYKTDDAAIAAYMAKAGMSERSFMMSYSAANIEAGDAFAASYKRDPVAACEQIWRRLGDPGLGLVTRDDD